MDLQMILDALQGIITIVCGGLAIYFKFSTKAQTKAKQIAETIGEITAKAVIFIKEAEENYKDATNAGGKKFEEVVTKLYDLIPDGLDKIITREMIEEIVQSTFDEIEEYVATKLDEGIDKLPSKSE